MNKRVPAELLNLAKIKDYIDKRNMKYYKVGIQLNLEYRAMLRRLNGSVRFTVKELMDLSSLLDVDIDEFCKNNSWEQVLNELNNER